MTDFSVLRYRNSEKKAKGKQAYISVGEWTFVYGNDFGRSPNCWQIAVDLDSATRQSILSYSVLFANEAEAAIIDITRLSVQANAIYVESNILYISLTRDMNIWRKNRIRFDMYSRYIFARTRIHAPNR